MLRTDIYQEVQRQTLDGRELEASVLFRAAQKLRKCARGWENRGTEEFQDKLTDALQFNQKLWSYLQVDLGNPANPLPETLRMNLLQLSKFIDKRIFAVFAGTGTAEDLLSIAHINEQIGNGLQAKASVADGEEESADFPVNLGAIVG